MQEFRYQHVLWQEDTIQAPFKVLYGCRNNAGEVMAMKVADTETKGASICSKPQPLAVWLVADLTAS